VASEVSAPPLPSPATPTPPVGGGDGFLTEAGELTAFAGSAIAAVRGVPRYTSEVLRQASIHARGSTVIIGILEFLIGFSVINFAFYVLKSVGATDYTGLVSGIITPRGTTPLMFGYIFAAKVGCGMVAELGAMKVNEEIAAFESEGVDPMRYLVATRLAATLLFIPLAVGVALVAGTAGDYFGAITVLHGLSPSAFLRYHWGVQSLQDQYLAFLCMAVLAGVIVIVSCFYGLRARGGPASVGSAVARSLVVNLVLIHLIVPGYLALFYGTDPHLPIGG
jgi:phospholipid/cholesterol/gamma-HCH transport system permease protein